MSEKLAWYQSQYPNIDIREGKLVEKPFDMLFVVGGGFDSAQLAWRPDLIAVTSLATSVQMINDHPDLNLLIGRIGQIQDKDDYRNFLTKNKLNFPDPRMHELLYKGPTSIMPAYMSNSGFLIPKGILKSPIAKIQTLFGLNKPDVTKRFIEY
jgi:hypothetical protein